MGYDSRLTVERVVQRNLKSEMGKIVIFWVRIEGKQFELDHVWLRHRQDTCSLIPSEKGACAESFSVHKP